MSLFLWPILNAWQHHLRHTQIVTPLIRNILIRMKRTYLGYETRKWSLWESKKMPLFCSFFFSSSHLKTDWGLPPLYNDSVPFKVPENPTHLWGQSWVAGWGRTVIHLVSSSGRRALVLLQLVQDWEMEAFKNLQWRKITWQAGKILKKKLAHREMKLWLY